ncbi:fibronectin type III domain-containing protein [Streptomyces sp. NRRL S-495]|uniref:fibronectin type III domain-containing protein n=1 Tax=Streptomyces sp. NRRL S-495 TaxID=1609133 RepID=UPI0013311517|nr:fibronectin type III domain-containing protein [Streptomyces sp. NRRL S-495]
MAIVLGLAAGSAGAAGAAPSPVRASVAVQGVQAPLIDSVQPFATGTVQVTVTPGDTAQEAVARVDVSAYALDADGNATGAPVATGTVQNPDPANPPVVEIGGLTNDVSYAFKATETTAGGVVSGASPAFVGGPQTPRAPLAPTLATLLGRDGGLLVSWNPAHPNGSPVTGYTVTATPNGPGASVTTGVAGDVQSTAVTGLVNGKYYSVSVTATNAAGTGPAGVSDSQTVGADANGTVIARPAYTVGAPQDVTAAPPPVGADGSQPGPTALKVTWDAPLDDGGNTITNYAVDAAAPGQPPVTAAVQAATKQATLTSLAPGVEYAITVTAVQQDGARGATSAVVKAAPAPVLAAGTVMLSAASTAAVTKVTGTTVVFTDPPAQVTGLKVKNVIVVGQSSNPLLHDGLLRTVERISAVGGVVTLTTSQAALEQAFLSLDFTATGSRLASGPDGFRIKMLNPDIQASVASQAQGSGTVANKTFTLDLAEKLTSDPKMKERLGDNTTVTAKLTAALSLSTDWSATAGFERDPNYYAFDPRGYTGTFDFSATATAKASVEGELGIAYKHETKRDPLLNIKPATCLTVYMIQLCPSLTVYTETSIDGSIKFSFSASYERTMGGRISRDNTGTVHKTDLTKDPVTKFDYALNAAAKVTFAFPVALEILVYNLVGPRLEITPSIEVTADTSADPWLTVKAPLKVALFFVLDIKVASFSTGGDVYNTTFDLYKAPGPFPGPSLSSAAALAPGARSAPSSDSLTAAAQAHQYTVNWPAGCDPAQAVAWSMAPGSLGTVDRSGLYTPPHPRPSHYVDLVTATTAGTPTCPPATAQAAVHHGSTLPGAPKHPAISPDGSTVTWTAPAAGGSAIQEYVVTVLHDPSDPAGAETVLGTAPGSATSLAVPADRVAQIEADHARVQVTAVNDRGQGPASALSHPAPSTNPLPFVARAEGTANGGTLHVTPHMVNAGTSDATNVRYQLSYPETFTSRTNPSACTVDQAQRLLTCDMVDIASGHQAVTPLISFTVGRLVPGTAYPLTMTRLSASPYPSDPNNGTMTLLCTADTAGKVTCG